MPIARGSSYGKPKSVKTSVSLLLLHAVEVANCNNAFQTSELLGWCYQIYSCHLLWTAGRKPRRHPVRDLDQLWKIGWLSIIVKHWAERLTVQGRPTTAFSLRVLRGKSNAPVWDVLMWLLPEQKCLTLWLVLELSNSVVISQHVLPSSRRAAWG